MARHSVLICEPGTVPFRLAKTALSSTSLLPLDADRGVVNLDHANERLQVGFPERDRARGEVLSVALKWGFKHLGRFAAQYRAIFGVYPSDTAKKAVDKR